MRMRSGGWIEERSKRKCVGETEEKRSGETQRERERERERE